MRASEIIPIIAGVGIIPIVFGLAFGLASILNKNRTKAFKRFGEAYGLKYTFTRFFGIEQKQKLTGTCRMHAVEIGTYTRGSGKSKTVYTYVSLDVNEKAGFSFSLGRENFITGIGKKLGMTEQIMGDDQFDEFFLVKTTDVERLKEMTSDSVKQKLYGLFEITKNRGNLTCRNNKLVFAIIGTLNSQHVYNFIEGSLLFGVEWVDEMNQ